MILAPQEHIINYGDNRPARGGLEERELAFLDRQSRSWLI